MPGKHDALAAGVNPLEREQRQETRGKLDRNKHKDRFWFAHFGGDEAHPRAARWREEPQAGRS